MLRGPQLQPRPHGGGWRRRRGGRRRRRRAPEPPRAEPGRRQGGPPRRSAGPARRGRRPTPPAGGAPPRPGSEATWPHGRGYAEQPAGPAGDVHSRDPRPSWTCGGFRQQPARHGTLAGVVPRESPGCTGLRPPLGRSRARCSVVRPHACRRPAWLTGALTSPTEQGVALAPPHEQPDPDERTSAASTRLRSQARLVPAKEVGRRSCRGHRHARRHREPGGGR